MSSPFSTSSRDCPVCGEAVPWARYWVKSWISARWPCTRCGSMLGFNPATRLLMMVATASVYSAVMIFKRRFPLWVASAILVGFSFALPLLDRVRVVGQRSSRYCRACRYDLAGTLAAGIERCPECGHDAEARQGEAAT